MDLSDSSQSNLSETAVRWLRSLFWFWVGTVTLAWAASYPRIESRTEVVPGTSIKRVVASAHFRYNVDLVWSLLKKPEVYPSFVPRIAKCQKIGSRAEVDQYFIVMNMPWPFTDLWNQLDVRRDESLRKISWVMTEGNLKVNQGEISVEAEEGGSVMKIDVKADPGLFLPRWLVAWGAKNYLPKILRAVNKKLMREEIRIRVEARKKKEAEKPKP